MDASVCWWSHCVVPACCCVSFGVLFIIFFRLPCLVLVHPTPQIRTGVVPSRAAVQHVSRNASQVSLVCAVLAAGLYVHRDTHCGGGGGGGGDGSAGGVGVAVGIVGCSRVCVHVG